MTNRPGNGKDKQAARAELTRRLMQLAPKARLEAILDQSDAQALVRGARPDELYATIHDVGLADSAEIVQLASPKQFQAFVDLGAWQKDRLDPKQVLAWLRAARGDDHEEWMRKLHGVDVEALELVLRACTVVHDLEEQPDVNPPGVTFETPEGKFLVELTVEGVDQATVRAVLNDLLAENAFEAVRFLEATRWELTSELEETALRFRTARLSDLGFPSLDEAMRLFSFVDPAKVSAGERPLAQGLVPSGERVDYVEAAFRGLEEAERRGLEDEVRAVVNSALVAEGAEPGDMQAIRRVSEQARCYLNLGLEQLTGASAERGAQAVREHTLQRVFQLGFSLTLQLKFLAQRLERDGLRVERAFLTLDEEAKVLEALLRRRPLRALKVEGAEPVAFRSRRELSEARAAVERGGRQAAVLRALVGPSSGYEALSQRFGRPLGELGGERLLAAAVAHALLDGEAKVAPVPAARLTELCERCFEVRAGAVALREAAVARAVDGLLAKAPAAAPSELPSMVERVLARLRDEVGAGYLADGRVEPKALDVLTLQP